jgi:glycosyltransferase involved in cell wall biosynthesis
MTIPATDRVRVDGKFFRLGGKKFYVKGVTYGPFAANPAGEMFPAPDQARRDLVQLQQLGANVIRVYYVPPRWFLDLVHQHGLKVLVDIPWAKHLCFLDSAASQAEARRVVRDAVTACKDHPALFAFSVVNEISPEIVRWSGVARVQRFINELIDEARHLDPHCLFTFTSYPPTEFLQVDNADFVCFNVYLHQPKPFTGYLARLQTLADAKPLILGEFGMDSIREGESHKCEFLAWQIELAFRAGLAGTVVFSYTDDWWRGGMQITDWGFGLTTRERQPKDSFHVVQRQYQVAPHFSLPRVPKVSIVVATYNGGRTLHSCLESLGRLNYAAYEVILVDDGSTDRTPEIAKSFSCVQHVRQTNPGLAAARTAGSRAATGEIVAFTDDDCRADEDWLYYLVGDLLRSDFAGIGGHNFLPPEDSCVAAAVMASPGGPAHVLLTDTEAEHIPGCNMAYYKWALEQIGMFDPIFRKAGDDVDVCWRMQDGQFKIGFSPAAFVWHYRRSTVKTYLQQQIGYGEAEALLIAKHPEHYNAIGGALWHGRIYAPSFAGLLVRGPAIYHGVFGSAFFQRLYASSLVTPFTYCTTLGYHIFVNLPLIGLAFSFDLFLPLAAASLTLSLGSCAVAAFQAILPPAKCRLWSRPLIALLFFLQPIVRDWARFKSRAATKSKVRVEIIPPPPFPEVPETFTFWSDGSTDRLQFLHAVVARLDSANWLVRLDTGWTAYDFELVPSSWVRLLFGTATEELELGKKHFRCRITSRWSLLARILSGLLAIGVALLIFLFARNVPWIWFSLLALPLAAWFFESESAFHKFLFARLLDDTASAHKMVRLNL